MRMGEKSPTDELRAMLDERGIPLVELRDGKTAFESPILGVRVSLTECDSGFLVSAGYKALPPEQAIAATVGGSDVSALRAKIEAQSDYISKLRGEYKALDEQMERRCAEYRATIRKLKAELDAATVGTHSTTSLKENDVVHRKDCKYAHINMYGTCKYCDVFALKDDYGYEPQVRLDGNFFCGFGEVSE